MNKKQSDNKTPIIGALIGCAGTILAAVIGGVFLLLPQPTPTSSPPTRTLTFLETISGNYQLISWNETAGPITIGMGVKDGTLAISPTGDANWQLSLLDVAAGFTPSPEPRIRCKGKVSISSQQLEGVPGTPGNESIDWTDNMMSLNQFMWPAFCGWLTANPSTPFTLHIEGSVLEMKNSKGTFTWSK